MWDVTRSAVALGNPQAAGLEAPHELADADRLRAKLHHLVPLVGGNVVVVEVETATGDARSSRECVKLVERAVADDVRPHRVVCGPDRLVY